MHCRETDFLLVKGQNDGGEKSLRAAINFRGGGGGGGQFVPALGNSCLAAAAFRDLCFVSFQIVRELAVFFDLSGS